MAMTDFPMSREIVLRHGETTIGVMPDICLVSHFQVASWPVLYRASETGNVKRWGLPLMIPNFSRLKQGIFEEKHTTLPAHGFGRNLPWTIIEQDQASITIQLKSNAQTRSQYPYEFTFTAQILAGEQSLTYVLTMANENDEIMPIAPGFHPYFAIPQSAKNRLTIQGLPAFTERSVDWDSNPPNDPYPFPGNVSVEVPERGVITIEEEAIEGYTSLATMQVWSEPATAPDHDFVCFEPVVTSEDGLNRPQDRLNIPPQSTHKLILKLTARPF